jgi:hypothetical protein
LLTLILVEADLGVTRGLTDLLDNMGLLVSLATLDFQQLPRTRAILSLRILM